MNNAIPAGYDAGGMSYDIQVMQYFDSGYPQVTLTADGYNGSRTDPLYKWFFDGTSGYLTFMTNKIFDSNSYHEYNDYYIMSSRKENKNIHKNTNKCVPFKNLNHSFLENPTIYYINKYNEFYNV